MKCPKCENETFKARVVRGQRIKELPHLIPVTLQCANDRCSHNLRVYISREDLKFIRDCLVKIQGSVKKLQDEMRVLREEKPSEEKKGVIQRLLQR